MTVTSAYGLNQADQARVKTVNYGYFTDAKIKGSTNGIRVFSNSSSLSQYKVVAGRLAKTDTEIALNNTLKGTYHPGETITCKMAPALLKPSLGSSVSASRPSSSTTTTLAKPALGPAS